MAMINPFTIQHETTFKMNTSKQLFIIFTNTMIMLASDDEALISFCRKSDSAFHSRLLENSTFCEGHPLEIEVPTEQITNLFMPETSPLFNMRKNAFRQINSLDTLAEIW